MRPEGFQFDAQLFFGQPLSSFQGGFLLLIRSLELLRLSVPLRFLCPWFQDAMNEVLEVHDHLGVTWRDSHNLTIMTVCGETTATHDNAVQRDEEPGRDSLDLTESAAQMARIASSSSSPSGTDGPGRLA